MGADPLKNIVICCDGTCNDVVGDSTNVLRLYRTLERGPQQVTYYDAGVGTLPDPTKMTRFGQAWSKNLDSAIGHSVQQNACQAYRFLALHYEPDDKIFLFGFSRGAYTVRALAGMIHFLGLVRPEQVGLDKMAWSAYADAQFAAGKRFKHSFSTASQVKIHFLGVWDTVSAFGWFTSYKTVPYSANNPSIEHVRHAVSIDEHRACFPANLVRPGSSTQHKSLKQIWFAGVHSDVGGGYPEEESGLAKVALEWMYREAKDNDCLLDSGQIDFFLGKKQTTHKQCAPDPHAAAHNSTTGVWNLAELIPRRQWDHDTEPERMRWFGPNRYRRRTIPEGAVLHESVRERMSHQDPAYEPTNLPDSYQFGE